MSRLRTYKPMKRQSDKVLQSAADWTAVYAQVSRRSEGRCEFWDRVEWTNCPPAEWPVLRCVRQATDHHHVVKPRRSHHTAALVVHLCRDHHDRCDWPYQRGRLVIQAKGDGRFSFSILTEKAR